MTEPTLPAELVEARRTPLFDFASLPDQLAESHRTAVWGELIVQSGTVRYTDLQGDTPRDVGLGAGDTAVIEPGIEHRVEPATDARFFIQLYRTPQRPMVPGQVSADSRRRSGPWEHCGPDLHTTEEISEMVVRQYVDIVQDEHLEPYFNFADDAVELDPDLRRIGRRASWIGEDWSSSFDQSRPPARRSRCWAHAVPEGMRSPLAVRRENGLIPASWLIRS